MRRPAFSIIELVLVVAILGILAALAMPRFASASARRNLDVAAQRLLADLRHAQQYALARSQKTQVRFDAGNDRYLVGAPSPVGSDLGYTVVLAAPPMRCEIISTTLPSDQASFDGHGLAEVSGKITIASGRYQRSIEIEAGSFAPSLAAIEARP